MNLPWHDALLSRFRQLADKGELAHALLLVGETGIGKKECLYSLASSLLCEEGPLLVCRHCHSCQLLAAETHPDIHYLVPEEGKAGITIDTVRAVVEKINQTAQVAARKVILVPDAERFNRAAANALLKSLEEPPPETFFLLSSALAGRLPSTIRSRCQIHALNSPTREQSRAWLQTHAGDQAAIDELLSYWPGKPLLVAQQGQQWLERGAALQTAVSATLAGKGTPGKLAKQLSGYSLSDICADYYRLLLEMGRFLAGLDSAILSAELRDAVHKARPNAFNLLRHAQDVLGLSRAMQAGSFLNEQLASESLLAELQACIEQ